MQFTGQTVGYESYSFQTAWHFDMPDAHVTMFKAETKLFENERLFAGFQQRSRLGEESLPLQYSHSTCSALKEFGF